MPPAFGSIQCNGQKKSPTAKAKIIEIDDLLAQLNSPIRKAVAAASADLASLIWAGKISEPTLIGWLKGSNEPLRATVSWAVWDAGEPAGALEALLEIGAGDINESVRLYCLRASIDYLPAGSRRTSLISAFCNDGSDRIKDEANKASTLDK